MAYFASRVKSSWGIDAGRLLKTANEIATAAESRIRRSRTLLTLPEEKLDLLLTNSISPRPLHKTLILLDEIKKAAGPLLDFNLLALARALVSPVSNLHFGPEVGVGPAKSDAPVVEAWLDNIFMMSADISGFKRRSQSDCRIHHHDSRRILEVLHPDSVDAVITSPPYPNEKDYTRTTRLESVILGFINSKDELRSFKKNLVRSNTRTVYRGDDDDRWISGNQRIEKIANEIETRRIELGKGSGFERQYARVTRLYFGGMARHLSDLRSILRPGAQLAYVVGDQASFLRVMIRTGQLLAEIGESLGYEVVGIDLFRTRLATATREQLREEVVVFRWPGSRH